MTTEIIHNKYTDSIEEAGFTLQRGWDESVALALVQGSREPAMQSSVPRDMTERFVDLLSAEQWYKTDPERVVYALARQAVIAGVIWFSDSPRPEYGAEYTFAIRRYEAASGKGITGDFLEAAHMDFGSETIWLETSETNERAISLYVAHGYEEVARSGGRIMMVRSQ